MPLVAVAVDSAVLCLFGLLRKVRKRNTYYVCDEKSCYVYVSYHAYVLRMEPGEHESVFVDVKLVTNVHTYDKRKICTMNEF